MMTDESAEEPVEEEAKKPRKRRPSLKFTGERQIGKTLEETDQRHIDRYGFAVETLQSRLPAGSVVLDAACGVGYGSCMLADAGFMVIGVDKSQEAIDFAEAHWPHDCVRYVCMDLEDGDAIENLATVDGAVCIETLEHLDDPSAFIARLALLGPEVIVASVPNQKVVVYHPSVHIFHKRHFEPNDFDRVLQPFKVVARAYQTRKAIKRRGWMFDDARTLLAVATME